MKCVDATPKYSKVITALHIEANHNVPGFLQMLSDSGIRMPADKKLSPSQKYLKWHRSKWRLV